MAPFHSLSLQYSSSTLTSASASANKKKNKSRMTMNLDVFDHRGVGFMRMNPQCSCINKRNSVIIFTTSNGSRLHCSMQVVNPLMNKRYETLSYVPPLSAEQIVKQVDYIVSKGWIPCLEFDQNGSISRDNSEECNYYDGRYWTLWKLPMFGCADASAVLREIEECKKMYPHAYIRLMAFDNERQTQVVAIVVHKPSL